MCVQVSTNLESPPIMGNCGVIGHLCLMDFIFFRHIKNGLVPIPSSNVPRMVHAILRHLLLFRLIVSLFFIFVFFMVLGNSIVGCT